MHEITQDSNDLIFCQKSLLCIFSVYLDLKPDDILLIKINFVILINLVILHSQYIFGSKT